MMRQRIPASVLTAAHERARARSEHDWPEADRLRAAIEAAGWRIVDRGTDFELRPAAPADVSDASGRPRYGSSATVPSRLGEPAGAPATVVLIATDQSGDLERTIAALRRHAPPGTQVVITADAPDANQEAALEILNASGVDGASDHLPVEVVWTSARLGHAAALNAAIRRSVGEIIVILDTSVEPTGDVIAPLVATLADPTVAVVGGWGLVSRDLRRFDEAPAGDVDAIEGYLLAFRRDDYSQRGPLDEHFRFYRNLDIWWSLVLRDSGPGERPRRAVRFGDLSALRHEHRGWTSLPDDERARQSKRNFYRIIDRFGSRRDLLVGGPG